MRKTLMSELNRLKSYLQSQPPIAIAVSGGVDSLTLAWVAHETTSATCQMIHAVSPAVPPEATALVKHYADKAGWNLTIINAQEYDDPRYRNNPVNRCYYCKTNLYTRIRQVTQSLIASGTNTDDLGDYRPGLQAAEQHSVIHPYVEANIDKIGIRQIAMHYGLKDVATLPAQPCLASRVETGIEIKASDLQFINAMETMVRQHVSNGDVRCRLTHKGVKIEIDPELFMASNQCPEKQRENLTQKIEVLCNNEHRHFIGISDYSRGSAFIHSPIVAADKL